LIAEPARAVGVDSSAGPAARLEDDRRHSRFVQGERGQQPGDSRADDGDALRSGCRAAALQRCERRGDGQRRRTAEERPACETPE
jgi:hypothetical protein